MHNYCFNCFEGRVISKIISIILIVVIISTFFSGLVVFGAESYAKVTFGKTINAINISVSGGLIPLERGGRMGSKTAKDSWIEYAYFNIDDNFLYDVPNYTPIDITVEYYDQTEGCFALSYDSHNPDPAFSVTNDVYAAAEYVTFTGTNTWKTHTFHIEDGKFANSADRWADFRIGIWDPYMGISSTDVILASVCVERSKYKTPIEFEITSDHVGNIFSAEENIVLKQNMFNKADEKVKAEYDYEVTDENGWLIFENTKFFVGVLSITSCIVIYRSTLVYEPS